MPRKYSMEARRETTAARHQGLVDAAIEVLGEVGADRFTMEAVAERADTAVRTVYNHFGSRDELIAEALGTLLAAFRDDLVLEAFTGGEPRERLRRFVELIYGIYARQGASLTTLLDHRDVPAIDTQVREMRAWRTSQLERLLRGARSELRLPLAQAVAIAFVLTNHASWQALVEERGLAPAKAVAVASAALDAALFDAA